jgi:hypothetical protein
MHTGLWNNLEVEVRHFLKKPDVFEQHRAPRLTAAAMFWLSSTGRRMLW